MPRVSRQAAKPAWRERLLRATQRHGDLKRIADAAGMTSQQLKKVINSGDPRLSTLDRCAKAVGLSVDELLRPPRPERTAGREDEGDLPGGTLEAYLGRLVERGDAEFPAEDSWQGDVHQAIAALNRALRRSSVAAEVDQKARKT